jgi:transposase
MSRPIHIDVKLVAKAQRTVKTTRELDDFRSALAVLLPAKVGLTLVATASMLGVGTASVNRLQTRFQTGRTSASPLRNWGGRRQALLSPQAEVDFLEPWAKQARAAGLLVLSPIRAALAQRVGHSVKASVVWRLLSRHGWRKVAPDTKHPKNDPQVMKAWKKNSRKLWRPCSGVAPCEAGGSD